MTSLVTSATTFPINHCVRVDLQAIVLHDTLTKAQSAVDKFMEIYGKIADFLFEHFKIKIWCVSFSSCTEATYHPCPFPHSPPVLPSVDVQLKSVSISLNNGSYCHLTCIIKCYRSINLHVSLLLPFIPKATLCVLLMWLWMSHSSVLFIPSRAERWPSS